MNAPLELIALPQAPLWVTAVLCAVGVLTSLITASVGAGGGLLLLAVMTMFLPVASAIPLHGVIQLGSNASRAALLLRHVRAPVLLAFAAGAVAGAAAGSQALVRVPEAWLQLILGAFVLVLAWVPVPRLRAGSTAGVAGAGVVTTVLTLFVGATGPVVAAFFHALRLERLTHVGTFSACMLIQHGLKIAVFGLAGFAFGPYLPFLAAMLVSAFVGTWLGRQLLLRLDDARFHRLLAAVLTLLALRLLYLGVTGVLD